MYDVVVVGAGPVGSYTAAKLAEAGFSVAVLEQKSELDSPVCCTGIVSPACFASFQLDKGLILRQVSSARLFSPGGKTVRLVRPETQAYVVDRAALNLSLAGRAQAKGAHYRLGCAVNAIEAGDNAVTIRTFAGQKEKQVTARAVVVATGFRSRQIAGTEWDRVGDFAAGAQVEVEAQGLDEVEIYCGQDTAPGFFAWLVPTGPGRALAGLLARRRTGIYLQRFLCRLRAQGKVTSAMRPVAYRSVSLKPLPQTCSDRLIIVGDAAGQVKPTTGGGIYYGLTCADIAIKNLSHALNVDDLSRRSLSDYDREWQQRLGRELRFGYFTRKIYEHLTDSQIDRLFDIANSDGLLNTVLKRADLSFDCHGEAAWHLAREVILAMVPGK